MKIIEPYIERWKQAYDVKAHIAKCARVCYGKKQVMMMLLLILYLKNIIGVCLDMKVFML